ncbi:hypothetical protein D3C81_2265690 [compost metagenome]
MILYCRKNYGELYRMQVRGLKWKNNDVKTEFQIDFVNKDTKAANIPFEKQVCTIFNLRR